MTLTPIPTGNDVQVNTTTANVQVNPVVTAMADGGFVMTWMSLNDGGNWQTYGQRFDANGAAVGTEFRVNTFTPVGLSPCVTAVADGGFVVTWSSSQFVLDGSGRGIFCHRFDASGAAVGFEFRVNTFTTNSQDSSSVTALADGGFVVTWS